MSEPLNVCSDNLSQGWREVVDRLLEPGVEFIVPLNFVLKLPNGILEEDTAFRQRINDGLARHGKSSVETVANTIFPMSLWTPSVSSDAEGRKALYDRYDRIWPKVSQCRQNRRGTYFRRMTHYKPIGYGGFVNQLEHIITAYKDKGIRRKSALQFSIFDPTRDFVDTKLLGFPCMQQVAFSPFGDDELCITGFYARQYLIDKAYGNYLGLCRLGSFVAGELGLKLTRLCCVASVASRGNGMGKAVTRDILGGD